MSANKIDALDKRVSENHKKAEKLKEEVEQLEAVAASYAEKAEKAAESGDVVLFKTMKQKAEDAKADLYVKQATFNKLSAPCTEEEAREIWAETRREYDTALSKALKEYDAEMKKQCARFMSIIRMQLQALNQRNKLGELAGMTIYTARAAFEFDIINTSDMSIDRMFFARKEEITREESNEAVSVFTRLHM